MNRKEYDNFLRAVDIVCGECIDMSEKKCNSCPVRVTCDHLRNIASIQLFKVGDAICSAYAHDRGMTFLFKYGDRGIYGMGRAWYLSVLMNGSKELVATFSVKDDGHKTYLEDYLSRLWTDDEALDEANRIIRNMLASSIG